ncbi:MAG: YhbY family RNA-binding protein [Candidatus Poseidoniales archaeon]|nr:YhbY family RNA-binding protein [Candidatus Poseidoniales archaeon]
MSKMSLIPNHIKRMAMDRDLLVSVRVGRNGLTEAIVEELNDQLNKRNLVKVKANRGVLEGSNERIGLFSEMAESTQSTLVFQRGNVAVFWSGN